MTCFSASNVLPSHTEGSEHIRREAAKRGRCIGILLGLFIYLSACLFFPVTEMREREREAERVFMFRRCCPLLRFLFLMWMVDE